MCLYPLCVQYNSRIAAAAAPSKHFACVEMMYKVSLGIKGELVLVKDDEQAIHVYLALNYRYCIFGMEFRSRHGFNTANYVQSGAKNSKKSNTDHNYEN